MAAGAFQAYEKGLQAMLEQNADFEGATIKAALLVTAHTVDVVNDEFLSDVSADECADGDYARQTLTTCAITQSAGSVVFDCDNIDFGDTASISARYLVFFVDTGTPTTSHLLFICDLNTGGGNLTSVSGDFDITINDNGIYAIDVNP